MWLVLAPPGVDVDVRVSTAVTRPLLVTREQVLAAGEIAAVLAARGIPYDLEALLATVVSAPANPDQQVLPLEPPVSRAQEHPCVCAMYFNSELKLREHQKTCGMYQQGFLIPPEHRI
jgi:hypothetical protein